jgi:hypothetical protein
LVLVDETALWLRGKLSNRARIVGPNGPQELIVPVIKSRLRVPLYQVRISYADDWIRVHIGALEAAYNSSPFFPMFRDELFSAIREKPEFLYELNHRVNQALFRSAGIKVLANSTEIPVPAELNTLGHDGIALLPSLSPYAQPFAHKHGFTGGLCGVDLISCIGRLRGR